VIKRHVVKLAALVIAVAAMVGPRQAQRWPRR
jgi:hypothetical protein